ncbi:MAG: hypothetical protein ACREC0_15325 [Methylocella sp.]
MHFPLAPSPGIVQAERFSARLTEQQIRRACAAPPGNGAAIKAYIDAANAEPKPVRWTKSAGDILAAINRSRKRALVEHRLAMLKSPESGH